MNLSKNSLTGPPDILKHDLNRHFPELLKFDSTPEMEASELYAEIRPEVERIMNAVVVEELVGGNPVATAPGSDTDTIHALAWNIERGIQIDGIIEALKNHPGLQNKDILLLTELD